MSVVIETRTGLIPHGVASPSIVAGLEEAADFRERASRVATVAAAHADAVDRDRRFPAEALAALRQEKLLAMLVPQEFGGEGAGASDVADVCYILGRACSATAMIFAMHQVKMACVIRHAQDNPWLDALIRRLPEDQLLFASSTTEGNNGGNVRSSAAAVEVSGSHVTLDRAATVISYGAYADGIVTTARRETSADASDQVLLVLLRHDYNLEPLSTWDTLGMRGTVSTGFRLRARALPQQVLPEAYHAIHAQTMTPCAHIFWSSAWTGIAAAAVTKAQNFVRHVSRQSGGQLPPGAAHLNGALSSLATLRAMVAQAAQRFEMLSGDADALSSISYQNAILMLKVEASERAVSIVMEAMRAGGLAAYRQDGEFAMGRYLRDVLSAPIMIHNDRIRAGAATASVLAEIPQHLAS